MSDPVTGHSAGFNTMSPLMRVREAAKKEQSLQFTSLMHHLTPELLKGSFYQLKRGAAKGIDGISWKDFQENLDKEIQQLHEALQCGHYKPLPSRRVFIPKADGTSRPLSIQCIRDKVVQQAVVILLNQIYEVDFMGFSYGFRPKRSQHDALDALTFGITKRKISWVLDLDIQKFFDTVDHDWLVEMVRHRIKDERLITLMIKWIRVGSINDEGRREAAKQGVPQGAVISPLLANIYLHYVFDLWSDRWRRQEAKGEMVMVRFADDAVLGFQYEWEAKKFASELKGRLGQFGLTLHPKKTRLIRFGRFAQSQNRERGIKRTDTFTFLGFIHYCTRMRNGQFKVGRKTAKLTKQIKDFQAELSKRLHVPVAENARWIASVLRGHINYFGVPGNTESLSQFHNEICRRWLKSLRRRSQKSNITWAKFGKWVRRFLPKVRVVHPYPITRFFANHSR